MHKAACPRAARVRPPSPSLSVWQLSSQQHEEGERALQEARRIEADHQSRLRFIQQRLERAQQQEEQLHQANTPLPCLLGLGPPCQGLTLCQQLLFPFLPGTGQERLSLARQRRQLEQLRQELPSHRMALDPSGPTAGLSHIRGKASRTLLMGRDVLGGHLHFYPASWEAWNAPGSVQVPLYITLGCELASSSSEGAGRAA